MAKKIRCEGWTRRGGVFTLGGLPKWSQCENDAVVMLTVEQEEIEEQPACMDCWNTGIENEIKILSAVPIQSEKENE